jgi:hypothetical protein
MRRCSKARTRSKGGGVRGADGKGREEPASTREGAEVQAFGNAVPKANPSEEGWTDVASNATWTRVRLQGTWPKWGCGPGVFRSVDFPPNGQQQQGLPAERCSATGSVAGGPCSRQQACEEKTPENPSLIWPVGHKQRTNGEQVNDVKNAARQVEATNRLVLELFMFGIVLRPIRTVKSKQVEVSKPSGDPDSPTRLGSPPGSAT